MPLPVPQPITALLDEADSREEDVDELDLALQLAHAPTGDLAPAERKGAHAEVSAFYFRASRGSDRDPWAMYWQPMASVVDEHGAAHHNPDVDSSDNAVIDHWGSRATASRHPVLRARYADLAWEVANYRRGIEHGESAPARPSHLLAHTAIDAYLAAIAQGIVKNPYRLWQMLHRAGQLAASLSDDERRNKVRQQVFATREVMEAADPNWRFWEFDNVARELHQALSFDDAERAIIVDSLERALAIRIDQGNPDRFDPIVAGDAADRLRYWRELARQPAEANRATAAAAAALEAAAERAPALTAIAWLEQLLERYRRAGDRAGCERVERAIRARGAAAQGEMRRIEARIDVDPAEFHAWADRIAGDSFDEGMKRMAMAGLLREGNVLSQVRDLAAQAPLMAHMPISITRRDGFTSAIIGSVEDDPGGRAIYHAAQRVGMEAPWLHGALDRIREKHEPDAEKIAAWLGESPIFPPDRIPLIREGLSGWLAGDAVKAVHVLVPQIEASIRDLIILLGGSVIEPGHYRGTRVRTFGSLLNHPRFREGVPADIGFHLQVLYSDPRGLNLRNEISHGMASPDLLNAGAANWVIQTLAMLRALVVRTQENDEAVR